ncbi:MAG: hypothetical protein ACRDI3_00915 [Actinomycetota bacterium]
MADRLEALLIETGRAIEWPEEPDLVARVSHRIAAEPRPRAWLPRVAFAAAVIVLLGAGLLVFSPATRTAIADFLGIGGVKVSFGPTPEGDIGREFDLGAQVADVAEAEQRAGFDVLAPNHPDLGDPDEVWVDENTPAGALVALVYGPRMNISPPPGEDASVVFTQFRAPLAGDDLFFGKVAPGGTEVTKVRIGEVEGYWLEGDAHFFYYHVPGTGLVEESVRVVGNVLLWEQDGFTFRLEVGDQRLTKALEIATTLR